MLKFLRKYNKVLFAFFSVTLMLTWLVPSAIQEFSQQSASSNAVWATVGNGETITMTEQQKLARQIKILDVLQLPMSKELGIAGNPGQWYLLVREAKQAGLVGGASDGKNLMQKIAGGEAKPGEAMSQQSMYLLSELCRAGGSQPPMVYETLAELSGVARMLNLAGSSPRMSETRLKSSAQNALTGLSADVVVISADMPLPTNDPQPTPEQVENLVKDNANLEPGKGPHGVGYRQTEMVQLEWFVLPAFQVRDQLANDPRLSNVALRKAFLRNPTSFGAKIGEVEPNFDSFKDQVRAQVLNQLTKDRLNEIVKFIADQSQLFTRTMPKDGIYAKLPDDWKSLPGLPALATDVAKQFGVSTPQVETVGPTPVSNLASMIGIGTATSDRFGTQPTPFGQVISMTKELNPSETRGVLQVGVIGPPLRAPDPSQAQNNPNQPRTPLTSDIYAFRVLQATPAHAAVSAEEVGKKATDDAQKLLRFAVLESNMAAIDATAQQKGLEALAQEYNTKVNFVPQIRAADMKFVQYGMKMPTAISGLGEDAAVVNEIVKRSLAIPQGEFANASDAARTFVIASPDKLALVVVHVREVLPMYAEDFNSLSGNQRFRSALSDDNDKIKLVDEFSFKVISERNKFKQTKESTEPTDASAPTPPLDPVG
ncbi:MAG: hypothetical protein EXS12_08270 [Phycisphaerales bacterium]|nr:hypothetical protein [Phycisphaerales bacterium]